MSDDILIKLSHQIGELTGNVNAVIHQQKEVDSRVTALLEKHDARIDRIEGREKTLGGLAIGAGLASGAGASGVMAMIIKVFSGG